MSTELISFSNGLRSLINKSNQFTKVASECIDFLDTDVSGRHKIVEIFKAIELKRMRIKNINLGQDELEDFLRLLHMVQADRLEISQGHRGLIDEYIQKLENIQKMEKYVWIKEKRASDTKPNSNVRVRRRVASEIDLQTLYMRFESLMKQGESFLLQEFIETIMHYSCNEQTQPFFDFMITVYKPSDNNKSSDDVEGEILMFLPWETIKKLKQICSWFLKREMQYELYDEKNEHCDINQKLKFGEIRLSFLKSCLTTYFKINSLSTKKEKDKSSKNHENIQRIKKPSIFQSGDVSAAKSIFSYGEASSHTTGDQKEFDTVSNLSVDASAKQSKPVEYIEVFADNLDFSLKLLEHDNIFIQYIYQESEETQIELVSKLTILVIEQIQREFENFFTNWLDFTKLANNGSQVVLAITRLVLKVYNLKAKTTCLQTEDITSASKLVQFSLKLNEISSQIFASFLDVVKTGHFDNLGEENGVPKNFSLHPNCKKPYLLTKFCDIWNYINNHETYLMESVRIVCDSHSISSSNVSKSALKSFFSSEKKKKDKNSKANEDEDDDDDDDDAIDEEEMRNFQNSRRANRSTLDESSNQESQPPTWSKRGSNYEPDIIEEQEIDRLIMIKSLEDNDENFFQSSKFYFGKYYMLLIEKIQNYLIEEATKVSSLNQIVNFNFLNSSSFSSNFNTHMRHLKANVFLASNLNHIFQLCNKKKLFDTFRKINPEFESVFKGSIDVSMNKACELFDYLNSKWEKLVSLNVLSNNSNVLISAQESSFAFSDDEENGQKGQELGNKSKAARKLSAKSATKRLSGDSVSKMDNFDKQSMMSVSMATSSKFKFSFRDEKKKRRNEFFAMLRETIVVCVQIKIESTSLRDVFRERVWSQIGDIIQSMESMGELEQLLSNLNISSNDDDSLSDRTMKAFFSGLLF